MASAIDPALGPADGSLSHQRRAAGGTTRGKIEGLSLLNLARLLAAEKKTCTLVVPAGGTTGLLFFADGELVDASLGDLVGLHAAYRTLASARDPFEIIPGVETHQRTIHESIEKVLRMAQSRQLNDLAPAVPARGGPSARPEDREGLLPPTPAHPAPRDGAEEDLSLEEGLRQLLALPAEAVAVVDQDSGMCLGTAGGLPFFEVVAAMSTEILAVEHQVIQRMAARDQVEDVLLSLGGQYHILRPLSRRLGLCLFLVLDRRRVKLAWARYRIAEIERRLRI
jgi:Domain of unknown function (DUF4388)